MKQITNTDVKRLRNWLLFTFLVSAIVFVVTLLVPVIKSGPNVKLVCESAQQQLGLYLLFSSFAPGCW